MSQLKVKYVRSDALRQQMFVQTGQAAPYRAEAQFDMAQATPEQRAIVYAFAPTLELGIQHYRPSNSIFPRGNTFYHDELPLAAEPTLDDVLGHITRMQTEQQVAEQQRQAALDPKVRQDLLAAIAEIKARIQARRLDDRAPLYSDAQTYAQARALPELPEYETALVEYEALKPQFQAEQDAAKAEQEQIASAQKAARQAAKLEWTTAHGSARLRRGLEAGHSCDRLYQIERAALEYPDYVLDYEGTADWKDRSCPTTGALDERDAVLQAHPAVTECKIVWLTDAPHAEKRTDEYGNEEYDDGPFQACEAVVVDDPNYNKWLVSAGFVWSKH